MQQYADIHLLLNYSTCFGRPSRPSSSVHKTVVAALVQIILSEEQASSNVTKLRLVWDRRSNTSPYLITYLL